MNRKILIFVIFVVAVVLTAVKIGPNTEVIKEYFPKNGDVEESSTKDITAEMEKEVEVEKESEEVIIKDKSVLKEEKILRQIVYSFLGTPYERDPLGEKEGEKYTERMFLTARLSFWLLLQSSIQTELFRKK